MTEPFVWRDAGRTVVFRPGILDAGRLLLAEHGIESFTLLTSEWSLPYAPGLRRAAITVHEIPGGQVPALAADVLEGPDSLGSVVEVSGGMRDKAQPRPLVALGGGRVIDVAKAVASVTGSPVAAIPTTMSGAEMTGNHRLPAGFEDRVEETVRPALVLADPEVMTSQPEPQLRASSMNALAHGADSLYTPLANPVSEWAALRGAGAIATALDEDLATRDRAGLALGSLLCGYAIDSAGMCLHHVVCQSLVRLCGTPHAETNAAILPVAMGFLLGRAPNAIGPLAAALATYPERLEPRLRELGGDPAGLGELGGEESRRKEAIEAMLSRPELGRVPGPPVTREELTELVGRAW